jgi:AcrR family transcriptional regulator
LPQKETSTRDAIKVVALEHFCRLGYQRASLEGVASDLGITRSAVLFHYGSKSDLLQEIAEPFEADLDRILNRDYKSIPVPVAQRKALITDLVDCYLTYRRVVVLLIRDVTSHDPLDISPRIASRTYKFFELFAGPDPSPRDRLILRAMIGGIINPLTDPELDLEKPALRQLLIDTALHTARRLSAPPGAGQSPTSKARLSST